MNTGPKHKHKPEDADNPGPTVQELFHSIDWSTEDNYNGDDDCTSLDINNTSEYNEDFDGLLSDVNMGTLD